MPRPIKDAVTAFAGISLLVVALAAIDGRVRDALSDLVSGRAASGELMTATARAQDVAWTVLDVARDQSVEHAALTIFALGALVLLTFMLRS